jgi:hypothetical protein
MITALLLFAGFVLGVIASVCLLLLALAGATLGPAEVKVEEIG